VANKIVENVLRALEAVLPANRNPIPLHEPVFRGNEWAYVKECLDSGWVSSVGKYVDRFEGMLTDFTGVERAAAVVNGTAALHTALMLVGVHPNDEVLSPTLTFVATSNAIAYCGAIPHFVDSEPKTLGVDPTKLLQYLQEVCDVHGGFCINKYTGRTIRALVVVHLYGHPVDMEPLAEICERYNLTLIEDAAESLGSYYKGKHTGHWGKITALSFNGNKTITTGGGGAILTNDHELGNLAKHVTTTARLPRGWLFFHDQVGYNYRMPNINAALGCAQMEELPDFLSSKRALAQKYRVAFSDVTGVDFFVEPDFARSNYWLNVILLNHEYQELRDSILEETNARGIGTRPAWTLLHKLPMYQSCPRMELGCAESLESRIINIPSGPNIFA
jgi:perosamine synthetase